MPRHKKRRATLTPLTPRLRAFANGILAGLNQSEALRAAAPELARKWKPESITTRASDYAALPQVRAYIETELAAREQRRRDMEQAVLTRMHKRAFLGSVVRAHELHDRSTRHFRAHDPLTAIQIDNKMTGDDAPVKVEGEITLGVIMTALKATTGLPPDNEMAEGDSMDARVAHATPVAPVTEPAPALTPPPPAPSVPPPQDDFAIDEPHSNGNGHTNGNGSNGHGPGKRRYGG